MKPLENLLNENELLRNKIARLKEELGKLEAENHKLYGYWKEGNKMVIELQSALADRLYPGWKSRGCLSVAFRGNRN